MERMEIGKVFVLRSRVGAGSWLYILIGVCGRYILMEVSSILPGNFEAY
jgi:hypothetical protein